MNEPQQPDNNTESAQVNLNAQDGADQSHQPQLAPKPTGGKGRMFVMAALGIAMIIAVAVIFLWPKESSAPSGSNVNQGNNSGSYNKKFVAFDHLLRSNQQQNGVALGYVKRTPEKTSRGNFLFPKVQAADEAQYDQVVFYLDTKGLTSFNTRTKATQLVVDTKSGMKSGPIFSSIAQRLAFSTNSCTVEMLDMATNKTEVLQQGKANIANDAAAICYRPVAWSPDGSKLLMLGSISVENDLGLVGYSAPYVYNVTENKLAKIAFPEGYDSTGTDPKWMSDNEFLMHAVKRGKLASTAQEAVFRVGVDGGKATKTAISSNLWLTSIQTFGDAMYAIMQDDDTFARTIVAGTMDKLDEVKGSNNASTFLAKPDATGTSVTDLYFMAGNPGTLGGIKLSQLSAKGGDAKELVTPEAYSAYILGWGMDFDQIVYISTPSGKAELHVYTISTGKDELVAPNLPMIQ